MKAYLAIKFKEDHSNKALIEQISESLKLANIESYVMARDFEKWGEKKGIEPDVLMAYTFKAIDDSDFVVIEFSEKGVGLGIEAGYAFAQRKPIVVIAKEGSEISATLQGVAKRIFFYKKPEDLIEQIKKLKIEVRGVAFLIMSPDKKVLLQLRDGNSKRYKDMWCFPGGACDLEEVYLDAAVREIKEEYKLDVKKENCELLMVRVMGQMHVFLCKIDENQSPVLNEGADMKWMSVDEINGLTIGYNQGDIVTELNKYFNK